MSALPVSHRCKMINTIASAAKSDPGVTTRVINTVSILGNLSV